MSEQDQAQVDLINAQAQQIRAATAQTYVDMGVLDPTEIRRNLADDGVFDIETMPDDLPDDELLEMPGGDPTGEPPKPPATSGYISTGDDPVADTGVTTTNSDDKEWITVNGTPVPIDENGQMQGAVGEKIEQGEQSSEKSQETVAKSEKSGIIRGQTKPTGTKATPQQRKAIEDRLIGTVAKDGRVIKSVNPHACDRMVERGIPESVVADVLESKESITYPGNKLGKNKSPKICYQKDGVRVVATVDSNQVWTVIDISKEE